ncbi:MAG: hypothetical protein M0C28_13270 [Candidatus Moduliflexus flocculans]|nr:hypothetical protein [Candidatus Moduliflexus flocculans]
MSRPTRRPPAAATTRSLDGRPTRSRRPAYGFVYGLRIRLLGIRTARGLGPVTARGPWQTDRARPGRPRRPA